MNLSEIRRNLTEKLKRLRKENARYSARATTAERNLKDREHFIEKTMCTQVFKHNLNILGDDVGEMILRMAIDAARISHDTAPSPNGETTIIRVHIPELTRCIQVREPLGSFSDKWDPEMDAVRPQQINVVSAKWN